MLIALHAVSWPTMVNDKFHRLNFHQLILGAASRRPRVSGFLCTRLLVATDVRGYQFQRHHRSPGAQSVVRKPIGAVESVGSGRKAAWSTYLGQPARRFMVAGSTIGFSSAGRLSESFPTHDEALGAFGESFSDDLGVERVWKNFGPVFKRPVRGDGRRASVIISL